MEEIDVVAIAGSVVGIGVIVNIGDIGGGGAGGNGGGGGIDDSDDDVDVSNEIGDDGSGCDEA